MEKIWLKNCFVQSSLSKEKEENRQIRRSFLSIKLTLSFTFPFSGCKRIWRRRLRRRQRRRNENKECIDVCRNSFGFLSLSPYFSILFFPFFLNDISRGEIDQTHLSNIMRYKWRYQSRKISFFFLFLFLFLFFFFIIFFSFSFSLFIFFLSLYLPSPLFIFIFLLTMFFVLHSRRC